MTHPDVTISTNGSAYDWSDWLQEKSSNALRDLARAYAVILDKETLGREQVLDLRSDLSGAVSDVVELVSFSAGYMDSGPHAGKVASAISREPHDALEDFLYHVGIIRETTRMARDREACELFHTILPLLDGPRGESRTLIHEALASYRGRENRVVTVANLTEAVTNGELEWAEYVRRCRYSIEGHTCVRANERGTSE
jgi:hypothetical protein